MAGMASAGSDWIVTMDEDGQHDPADIGRLLDCALRDRAALVYASPTNPPPHGRLRNSTSRLAKWTFVNVLADATMPPVHSYRLILGEIGRSIAAYAGSNVYLDVALTWVTRSITVCPVALRTRGRSSVGIRRRTLFSHFWKLVLTSGTRPRRLVSLSGIGLAMAGFVLAGFLLIGHATDSITVQGWTSVMVAILLSTGVVLFCLGVIAEYIGVAVRMAMGQSAHTSSCPIRHGARSGRQPPSSET